jgi:RNA polymerase sigma-70 factor (ECF subfamily)
VDEAARAFPDLSVPDERFAAALAARVDAGATDLGAALAELPAADVYLAFACESGDARALTAFAARYAGDVDAVLVRITGSKARREEVLQLLYQKLFVGPAPAIARYAGRSSLRTWLGATVARTVLNLVTRAPREQPVEDAILAALPAASADPELEHFKRLYAGEFNAALAEAVAELSARERSLLRYSFADGLSIDRIGALYGVHRASAARWVNAARRKLLVQLRRTLMRRLRVGPSELESIVRLIKSRIDVTLRRCLGGEGARG